MSERIASAAVKLALALWVALPTFALAQSYPPTKAGLRQLVADDAAMLPPPYAARLRKKEADWEKGIGVKCYNFPKTPRYCYPAAKDVITDIQAHIFKADGFVIDSDEWSDTIPSPQIPAPGGGLMPSGLPVALSQVFPKAVSPESPAAESFNEAAMSFGLMIWKIEGGPPRSRPKSDRTEDFEIDYAKNAAPLSGVISILFTWNDYSHSAAHGEFGNYNFNWNVTQKRPVKIGDIFDLKTDWKTGLAAAMFKSFQKTYPDYFAYDTTEDMMGYVSDPTRWAITKAGLRIDTDTEEIGGYMMGAPTVTASWASLKPYLNKNGLVALQLHSITQ